ncbi:hypothetical protein MMYC01_208426 [Madurella mycetomatis]|uniref:C2H2-type domain-containing protein n=1 Tax=Madurella mycetomatis TaxID=100816 RepID=A0A175VW64_9PEZI|nr:hypothetical protein MMYC01_208426 [Madurella mycetomatis]
MEASSKTPLQAGSHGPELPVRRDKDTVGNRPLERQDTTDSWASDFYQRRTGTGWSSFSAVSAVSAATDPTEPPSPVAAHFQDELFDLEGESYPASPRHNRSLSRSVTFQDCHDPDKPRGPRGDGRAAREFRESLPAAGDSVREAGAALDNTKIPDPATSKDERPQEGRVDSSRPEASVTEPHSPASAESLNLSSENGPVSSYKPDDGMIHEACGKVLKQVFGVELDDLILAGAASAAYDSVSYCLDELSHIVLNGCPDDASPLICEATRETISSYSVPIGPAGGTADYFGGGGENGGHNGSGGGAPKRPNGGHGGDGGGDGNAGGGKRQKVLTTAQGTLQSQGLRLSCPFRKRNPVKFNVRDFQSCAVQPFPDIPQLKRHVKNFHKLKIGSLFACPRCKRDMASKEALDGHLAVDRDQICTFRKGPTSADPEDGINSRTEDVLNDRKADSKIDSWEGLWKTLFPQDGVIPASYFVPPTELDEVYNEFKTEFCLDQLRQRIQEGLNGHDDAESLMTVFQKYIDFVFDMSPQRSSLQALKRPSHRHPTLEHQNREASDTQGDGSLSSSVDLGSGLDPDAAVPRPSVPYTQAITGYSGIGVGVSVDDTMTALVASSPGGIPGKDAVTVPAQVHFLSGYSSQGQLAPQRRLLSQDSGIDLHAAFAAQRGAPAGFPSTPAVFPGNQPFGSQNGYQNLGGFGQRIQTPCFPPVSQPHAVPRQASRTADSATDPSIAFYHEPPMGNGQFEGFPPQP